MLVFSMLINTPPCDFKYCYMPFNIISFSTVTRVRPGVPANRFPAGHRLFTGPNWLRGPLSFLHNDIQGLMRPEPESDYSVPCSTKVKSCLFIN